MTRLQHDLPLIVLILIPVMFGILLILLERHDEFKAKRSTRRAVRQYLEAIEKAEHPASNG
jgi:hypothetical protein